MKRLCKMFSLGQILKWPKTCAKRLYKKTRFVLCKKPLQKNTKYSRNDTILKIGHLAKALQNGQFGANMKMVKNMPKRFYKHIRVVLCKRSLEENTKYSRNKTNLDISYFAKAIEFAKWQEPITRSLHMYCTLESTLSNEELFLE